MDALLLLVRYNKAKGENKMTRNIGMILLAVFLILYGLTYFISGLSALAVIIALIAIVAGVFILAGR